MDQHATISGVRLPLTSLAVLADLEREGPTRMMTLSERIGSEMSRTSREVHALADEGLVDVVPDDTDRRAVVVTLTTQGRDQWRAYHDAARHVLKERLADWTAEEIDQFANLFDRFLNTLGPDALGPEERRDAPPNESSRTERKAKRSAPR